MFIIKNVTASKYQFESSMLSMCSNFFFFGEQCTLLTCPRLTFITIINNKLLCHKNTYLVYFINWFVILQHFYLSFYYYQYNAINHYDDTFFVHIYHQIEVRLLSTGIKIDNNSINFDSVQDQVHRTDLEQNISRTPVIQLNETNKKNSTQISSFIFY